MRWDFISDMKWEKNFSAAKEYYENHGDLNIPKNYVTLDGVRLGKWLSYLRGLDNSGKEKKYLTPERKSQLESIGMIWNRFDYIWDRNYAEACGFYAEHGHLNIPRKYVTPDGIRLGAWIGRIRGIYHGTSPGVLSEEQITKLNSIGMIWDLKKDLQWTEMYLEAKEYYAQNQNLDVPHTYVTCSGKALGRWIYNQRKSYLSGDLSSERTKQLENLNMVWEKPDSWMLRYTMAKKYLTENCAESIPQNVVVDGIWIGKWFYEQMKAFSGESKKKLTPEQKVQLKELQKGKNYEKELPKT